MRPACRASHEAELCSVASHIRHMAVAIRAEIGFRATARKIHTLVGLPPQYAVRKRIRQFTSCDLARRRTAGLARRGSHRGQPDEDSDEVKTPKTRPRREGHGRGRHLTLRVP